MGTFLVVWLAMGFSLDLLYLVECWLIENGVAGKIIQANFNRESRFAGKGLTIAIQCVVGLVLPPYVFAGLIFFAYRVKQERKRLREYGRA